MLLLGMLQVLVQFTGSLTCYLDQKAGGSADLFEDISLSTTDIVNEFNISINIGGTTGPAV